LVSTDVERAASLGLLSSRAKVLGSTLDLAANERALAKAIDRNRGKDVVLIDTVGHSPRDGEMIAGLAHLLRGAADLARLTSYLVLSATTARASLDLACEAFASAHPVGLVLTKLDESATPACGLELAHDRLLPLAFLCDGPSVDAHLARPKPAHIADLFLRGRLE
jgi:flagellar biosynthesis protein FlhF